MEYFHPDINKIEFFKEMRAYKKSIIKTEKILKERT